MPTNDMTLEHLLAKANGGTNQLANLVLAHEVCNAAAKDMSIMDKVLFRELMHLL